MEYTEGNSASCVIGEYEATGAVSETNSCQTKLSWQLGRTYDVHEVVNVVC